MRIWREISISNNTLALAYEFASNEASCPGLNISLRFLLGVHKIKLKVTANVGDKFRR